MTSKRDSTATPAKGAKCAICGNPAVAEFRPFCSRRCADVDLARWLNGVYAIPTADNDDDEDGDGGDGAGGGGAIGGGTDGVARGGRATGGVRPRR